MDPTHFESLYPDNAWEKEIASIFKHIKEGDSLQLVSFPGTGRTTILRLLCYNRNVRIKHVSDNQKWFHFVLVSCSEIRKKPLLESTKFLFISLVDSLRERGLDEEYQKAQEILKEHLSYNDELVLFQGLKRTIDLLAIEKELTIVFMFDRFDEYIPMLSEDFFANLRILRNRAKYRFSVIFSSNRLLEDMLEPALFKDFYEFFQDNTVTLSLSDTASLLFRVSYIEKIKEKKLPDGVLDEIIKHTKGHSKLTRSSAEALLSQPVNNGTIEQLNNNSSAFLLAQNKVQAALLEIWQFLTPSEQKCLQNVILIPAAGGEKNPSASSRDNNMPCYLEQVGLTKNGVVLIPLFGEFLHSQKQSVNPKESIHIDSQTGDIVKGNVSISDKLTSGEFRLLVFCLQNQDKIVSREDIIQAVWKDAKTTAGVTDQALDQLIFRLRKKIEDDPNNPTHLQTIKGRGFRFTA